MIDGFYKDVTRGCADQFASEIRRTASYKLFDKLCKDKPIVLCYFCKSFPHVAGNLYHYTQPVHSNLTNYLWMHR